MDLGENLRYYSRVPTSKAVVDSCPTDENFCGFCECWRCCADDDRNLTLLPVDEFIHFATAAGTTFDCSDNNSFPLAHDTHASHPTSHCFEDITSRYPPNLDLHEIFVSPKSLSTVTEVTHQAKQSSEILGNGNQGSMKVFEDLMR